MWVPFPRCQFTASRVRESQSVWAPQRHNWLLLWQLFKVLKPPAAIISVSQVKSGDNQRGLGEGALEGVRGQSKLLRVEPRGCHKRLSPPLQLRHPGASVAGNCLSRSSSRRPVSDGGSGRRQLPPVWTCRTATSSKRAHGFTPPGPFCTRLHTWFHLRLSEGRTSRRETLWYFCRCAITRFPLHPNGFEGNVMSEGLLGCRPREPPYCKNKSWTLRPHQWIS